MKKIHQKYTYVPNFTVIGQTFSVFPVMSDHDMITIGWNIMQTDIYFYITGFLMVKCTRPMYS